MALLSLVTVPLSFTPLHVPSGSVIARSHAVTRPSELTMQLPDLKGMGSKFMEQVGLGDGAGLSKEEQEEMETRLRAGEMSFDDFLKQVKVMQKAGNMQAMLKQGPFAGGGPEAKAQLEEGEKKMRRYAAFVEVMDEEERQQPALLIDEAKLVRGGAQPDRLKRLAEKSSSTVDDVGQFITEFAVLRKAAVAFANGEDPNTVKKMMEEEQRASRPPMNRMMRRQAAKKKKKAAPKAGGFGKSR